MIRLCCIFLFVSTLLNGPACVWAQSDSIELPQDSLRETTHEASPVSSTQHQKTFKTKYSTVHYADDKDIDDFVWRLGGQKLEFLNDPQLASNRIDRIISRVESILDMWPENLLIPIYLYRGTLKPNKVAFYEHKSKSIKVSIEYASDGVLAHEIAHAVINKHFSSSPPGKVEEILAQYVDKHLWSDY